jgi:hypothetical protein
LISAFDLEGKDRDIILLKEKVSPTTLFLSFSMGINQLPILKLLCIQMQLYEIKCQVNWNFEGLHSRHKEIIQEAQERVKLEKERYDLLIQEENKRIEKIGEDLIFDEKTEKERFASELQMAIDDFKAELWAEKLKGEEMNMSCAGGFNCLKSDRKLIQQGHDENFENMHVTYNLKMTIASNRVAQIRDGIGSCIANFKRKAGAIQEQVDIELTREHQLHENANFHELKATARLRAERDIKVKKYDALMKDNDEHKESILSLQDKQSDLYTTNERIKKEKTLIEEMICHEDGNIIKLEHEISSLAKIRHRIER